MREENRGHPFTFDLPGTGSALAELPTKGKQLGSRR
jgi:hypothetical protein